MRRVAIITGAGRGIGAATARRLAAQGWAISLVDAGVDEPALGYPLASPEELVAVARECGGLALAADVRDQQALDAAVERTVEHFGRLDAAVAVAGAIVGGPPAWQVDERHWELMLDINLSGVWRLVRAAVPHLLAVPREQRQGRLVAVASSAAGRGLPRLAAYSAAKKGVVGLIEAVAAELGPEQITANAVCPGSTATAMLDASAAVYELPGAGHFAAHQRLGRLLAPDEVAAAIAWLCGVEASAVTGASLGVDGGFMG